MALLRTYGANPDVQMCCIVRSQSHCPDIVEGPATTTSTMPNQVEQGAVLGPSLKPPFFAGATTQSPLAAAAHTLRRRHLSIPRVPNIYSQPHYPVRPHCPTTRRTVRGHLHRETIGPSKEHFIAAHPTHNCGGPSKY